MLILTVQLLYVALYEYPAIDPIALDSGTAKLSFNVVSSARLP